MMRYSISIGEEVNTHASKTGIKYRYWGRTNEPEKFIEQHKGKYEFGFRIKDSNTNEIIYKE